MERPALVEAGYHPSPASLLLSSESPSIFREGFYTPSLSTLDASSQAALPWKSVREVIEMADNALRAKQRAAEKLVKQLDVLRQHGASDKLLKRAQRAEVDCGSLLDELQQLIQAKADVAQQRADLDRANALLVAERELLCAQLQVSPDSVNLCQAVSRVLATAKRAKSLDVQLRLLAKCQRELLLQLEAQREAAARAERAGQQWQAEKQVFLQLLEQHGIKPPELPQQQPMSTDPAAVPAAAAAAGEPVTGQASSGSLGSTCSSSSAALMAQLMLMRMQSAGAASLEEQVAGSPCAQLPPGTPPAQELTRVAQPMPPVASVIRRSHSLDSGLNSLTGLLDQLALGQLCGSDDGTDHMCDDCAESAESWTMADTLSADMEPWFSAGTGGVAACAGGSSSGEKGAHGHVHLAQLQPVQEGLEDCC